MTSPEWLTARPVAHRGLHDAAADVVENTPAAFEAAIAGRYGIECDVQITADGQAMVHHDFTLGRLTDGSGELRRMTAAELRRVPFKTAGARMLELAELCDLVARRTPLLVELKSDFRSPEYRHALVQRVADILAGYTGPVAAMSFDPVQVQALRAHAPALRRGIVAQRRYSHAEERGLTASDRVRMAHLLHIPHTRPHFVAYHVKDLPTPAPLAARVLLGLPLLTWTVRTPEDRTRAACWASQMIFEGFRP